MPCARFTVRGTVQGVGFRWFVVSRARPLELAGWVRNQDDGGVEVLASGPDAALAALHAALRAGPPGASVESVSRDTAEVATALPHPFAVVR